MQSEWLETLPAWGQESSVGTNEMGTMRHRAQELINSKSLKRAAAGGMEVVRLERWDCSGGESQTCALLRQLALGREGLQKGTCWGDPRLPGLM